MLIDATGLPRETVLRAEYCVIGSGMGGAAVAHGLARAGRDVLLVEAGDERRTDERSAPVNADHVGRSFKLPLTRCIELGGTSNQWHGICGTLDEADFDHRPWIADSGWPIRRSDLEPFYAAAFALVGLPDGAPLDAAVDGGPAPAGASAARVSRRLADLPLDEGLAGPKIVQYRRSPFRWKPTLLGMARRGALTCLTNAPVLELIPDADGRTVIEALAGAGSDTIRIRARVFVVCCGALETPRLLLNSRARAAAGIGNAQGQVGRRLMDHPVGHVGKLRFLPKVDAPLYGGLRVGDRWVMAGLRLSPEQQRLHATGNHYTWIRPSFSPRSLDDAVRLSFLEVRGFKDLRAHHVRALLTHRDLAYRVLAQRLSVSPRLRFGDLYCMTEQSPDPESRVGLSTERADRHGYPVARVDWRLDAAYLEGFDRYANAVIRAAVASARGAVTSRAASAPWEATLTSAAHHLGTARMSASPSTGVVDSDLRVFGTRNLYVCDGSVFPTAGGINPSLTITALAIRLTGHLLSRRASEPTLPRAARGERSDLAESVRG